MRNLKLKVISKIVFVALFLFLCLGCTPQATSHYEAENIPLGATCSSCGMIVLNYAGPHAQVVWKDGKHSFYGDLIEVMPEALSEVDSERMGAVYVQNFGDRKWGSYRGGWIKAQDAFYVINSTKLGPMGISYIPFETEQMAMKFQKSFGGDVIKYSDITHATLEGSSKLMRDNPDVYVPKMKMQ